MAQIGKNFYYSQSNGDTSIKLLIELLQQDLRNLSAEAKKKYSGLREPLERGIMRLHEISNQSDPNAALQAQCSEAILGPISCVCDTKHPKLIQMSLQCIHRLLTSLPVTKQSLQRCIALLAEVASTGPEEVKVLQIVLLLTSRNSDTLQGTLLIKCIKIIVHLLTHKDPIVSSTASTTFRQLTLAVFEWAVDENSTNTTDNDAYISDDVTIIKSPLRSNMAKNVLPQLPPKSQDAHNFFKDLCQLTSGDPTFWIESGLNISRELGLELLESILNTQKIIFQTHSEFAWLLKEYSCPLLIKLFSSNITQTRVPNNNIFTGIATFSQNFQTGFGGDYNIPFPLCVRLLRVLRTLIICFHKHLYMESEIFITILQRFLEQNRIMWQKCLAIEIFRGFCHNPSLLLFLFYHYNMQSNSSEVITSIITNLSKSVNSLTSLIKTNQLDYQSQKPISTCKKQNPMIEMLEKIENPPISDIFACGLITLTLNQYTRSLAEILSNLKDNERSQMTKTVNKFNQREALSQMILSNWQAIISAINAIFCTFDDEEILECILQTKVTLIHLCCSLELSGPKDAIVNSLCKLVFPIELSENFKDEFPPTISKPQNFDLLHNEMSLVIQQKQVQSLKALLNLAHFHGGLLSSSWFSLLYTLQEISHVWSLNCTDSLQIPQKAQEQSKFCIQPIAASTSSNSELSILSKIINNLFDDSKLLSDKALVQMLQALCRLCTESIVQLQSINSIQSENPNLFSIAKIFQVSSQNLTRTHLFWDIITGHLLIPCQSQNSIVSQAAGDVFIQLIHQAIVFSRTFYENEKQIEMQRYFFATLIELSNIPKECILKQQLNIISIILQESLNCIHSSWDILLSIIATSASIQEVSIVKLGFRCLQYIISDCLSSIPLYRLSLLAITISIYGNQDVDINVTFSSVGQVWTLADYLYQNWEKFQISYEKDFHKLVTLTNDILKTLINVKGVEEKAIFSVFQTFLQKDHLFKSFLLSSLPWCDHLWMIVVLSLGNLCLDPRPTVRKSAGQSLFSTLEAHGNILDSKETWSCILWQLLFPVTEHTKYAIQTASEQLLPSSGPIVMHHSRDTLQKQWSETLLLISTQFCRLIKTYWLVISNLDDFSRIWTALLNFIDFCCFYSVPDVGAQTLHYFCEVLLIGATSCDQIEKQEFFIDIYKQTWKTFIHIGQLRIATFIDQIRTSTEVTMLPEISMFQTFLINLAKVGVVLFQNLQSTMNKIQIQEYTSIMRLAIECPIERDVSPFLVPSSIEDILTYLQECVMNVMLALLAGKIIQETSTVFESATLLNRKINLEASLNNMIICQKSHVYVPIIFQEMLFYSCQALKKPLIQELPKNLSNLFLNINYFSLMKISIQFISILFPKSVVLNIATPDMVLSMFEYFAKFVTIKFNENLLINPIWEHFFDCITNCVKISIQHFLPPSKSSYTVESTIWISEFIEFVKAFIFAESISQSQTISENFLSCGKYDGTLIQLIATELFPFFTKLPVQICENCLLFITDAAFSTIPTHDVEFSKICFGVLLKCVFSNPMYEIYNKSFRLLIDRCVASLNTYNSSFIGETLSSKAHRKLSENSTLRLLQTLQYMLQNINDHFARSSDIDNNRILITQISKLYIPLVDCCLSNSIIIRQQLRLVLQQFTSWIFISGTT